MSLNYQLPGKMTNGELAESHPTIHASLFGICVSTMHAGIPEINGKWLDRLMEAIDNGDQMFPSLSPENEREWLTEIYLVLRGMTTNASRKTEKQWKETLNT